MPNEENRSVATTLTLAYAVVAALLVVLLANGSLTGFFSALTLHGGYNEIYTFIAIAFLGTVASALAKESHGAMMAIGTVFGFIALTLNQEPLVRYLTLGAVLFAIGMYGMVVSRNAVRVLMSIELMLNAVNINLVAFARYVDPVHVRGQIFGIFILTVAAAEAAVGLAIVLAIYRNSATVDMDRFNLLKW
jgi:NAD(P)H-quinone oxidoreductase subunit 4L